MKYFALLLSFIFIFACKNKETEPEVTVDPNAHLEELYGLMQGSFNSEKQSVSDSTYYNISLHMYPIWEGKGHYLYVEQALNSMQDKPYRQRVYELTKLNDSVYSSAVYTLPNDSLWIGKWKTPQAFDSIPPSQLITREGCAVLLKRLGENHYKGSTDSDKCKSTLRGASYATSTVEITPTKIESWDQGFDAEGSQVWGAEKGGYIFDKLK